MTVKSYFGWIDVNRLVDAKCVCRKGTVHLSYTFLNAYNENLLFLSIYSENS